MEARHEYKHSLNFCDYTALRSRLRRVMTRDPYADANGEYKVRSLYFDTPDDKALREKIHGVDKREKFRIRRYLGDSNRIALEKKSKVHGFCYKQSTPMTATEIAALQSGDLTWMAGDGRELIRELYSKMRGEQLKPKTIVDYVREPFVCAAGSVRVTFDRDIRTGLFSTDFMNDGLPTVKAGDEIVLLEVKYDQFIPEYIVKILQLEARRAYAISKYALCRMYG
ncbi:MAG: polyphosphate polymerase domain-containing protein [Clostridiales bacterium]|jgi:hypothetical protein|nr:polyphosphate polymerase domain-containing protein [Clostridiales bacterium]